MENESLWVKVLKAKYGARISSNPNLGETDSNRFSSVWWKDLCLIGSCGARVGDWLEGFRKRIGVGDSVLFWHDTWFGKLPLNEVLPHMFPISSLQNGTTSNFGNWDNDVWHWDFKWRRNFFMWEEEHFWNFVMPSLLFSCDRKRISGAGLFILQGLTMSSLLTIFSWKGPLRGTLSAFD